MLSKKCVFWGGLYLVNIIAIFTSVSSTVIAEEGIHEFRSELNQISWNMYCSMREWNIYYNNELEKDNAWILGTIDNDEYEESRSKVIGKAIGDCVAGENEFENKSASDCIFFEKTLPATYERKHWNAVILYNYIHEAINRDNLPEDKKGYYDKTKNVFDMLKNCNKLSTLCVYYNKYCGGTSWHYLSQAVTDIQQYVNALKLNESLFEFRKTKRAYAQSSSYLNLMPNLFDMTNGDDGMSFRYKQGFFVCNKNNQDKYQLFKPNFRYYNNQLYISGLLILDLVKKPNWTVVKQSNDQSADELQKWSKCLLDRLGEIVTLPDEQFWKKWNKDKLLKKAKHS